MKTLSRLPALAALVMVGALLAACAVNPNATAQSPEQHADAIYGELVILKEQGARVLQDASVSDQLKRPIAQAIVDAKPITDGLQDALILSAEIKAEVTASADAQQRLEVVDRQLAGWIAKAQPLIDRLAHALAGVRK